MSETQSAPQVTGQMFLYGRPELLNPEQHGALGVSPMDKPFEFAANVRALPLTVSEIPAASRDYPVVFGSVEQPQPMAVVGIVEDGNLFVDQDGNWEEFRYVPGYVRRYPFGAAHEQSGERYAVVIDADYPGLKDDGERRLFEGKDATQFTKDAVEFTRRYEDDRRMTQQFYEESKKFDLLAPQTAQYTPQGGGDPVSFAQYIGFDENKLKELSDSDFADLRKVGLLPIIYGQLTSMVHWRTLVSRRAGRFQLSEADVFQPLNRA